MSSQKKNSCFFVVILISLSFFSLLIFSNQSSYNNKEESRIKIKENYKHKFFNIEIYKVSKDFVFYCFF